MLLLLRNTTPEAPPAPVSRIYPVRFSPHIIAEIDFGADILDAYYGDRIRQSSPWAWFRASASSGSEPDASGHGHTATPVGTIDYLAGTPATTEPGNAGSHHFDPSSGFSFLGFAPTALTVESWVNWSAPSTDRWLLVNNGGRVGGDSGNYLAIGMRDTGSATVFNIYHGNGNTTVGAARIPADTWTHVVVSLADNVIRIYLNGVIVASANKDIQMGSVTTGFYWGGTNNSLNAPEYMDEWAVYNRRLSSYEIAHHYDGADSTPTAQTWTNVTPWLRESLEIGPRGRQMDLGKVEPTRATLILDNKDRRFEPQYQGVITNNVLNPSFEVDLSGWTELETGTSSITATRDSGWAKAGTWGANVVGTVSASARAGIQNIVTLPAGSGFPYAASCWIKNTQADTRSFRIETEFLTAGGSVTGASFWSSVTAVNSGSVYRAQVTTGGKPSDAVSLRIRVVQVSTGALEAVDFYADAAQVENLFINNRVISPSDYLDGSLPDGRWGGTAHASVTYNAPYYPNVKPRRKVRIRAFQAGNLAVNGSFETGDLTSWSIVSGTWGVASSDDHWHRAYIRGQSNSGTGSRLVNTAPGSTGTQVVIRSSDFIPYDRDRPYTLTAAFKAISGTDISTSHSHLRLTAYDKNQTLIGNYYPTAAAVNAVDANITYAPGQFDAPTASWSRFGGTYPAGVLPEQTAFVKITMFGTYLMRTGVAIDAVELREGTAASTDDKFGNQSYDEGSEHYLFTGYTEDWISTTKGAMSSYITVPCVDGLGLLAEAEVPAASYPQEPISARIDSLLDAGGWSSSERNISTTLNHAGAEEVSNLAIGEAILALALAEWGVFYIAPDGTAVLQNIYHRGTDTFAKNTQATWYDVSSTAQNLTNLTYEDIVIDSGAREIVNETRMTRPGGVEQVYLDYASIQEYGRKPYSESPPVESDTTAFNRGRDIVLQRAQPRIRVNEMTVRGVSDGSYYFNWHWILRSDISWRFKIVRTPQGVGNPLNITGHVESISMSIDIPSQEWVVRYGLSRAL